MKITALASLTILLTLFAPLVVADDRRPSVSEQGWGAALKNPAGPMGNQGAVSSERPLKPPSVYQEKKEKEKSTGFNQGGVSDESLTPEARRELRRKRRSSAINS